jgi:predicted ATPase
LAAGFVARDGDFGYHFLHDRVQQAAYACVVPKRNQKQMHLDVAQFLMTKIKIEEDIGVRSRAPIICRQIN